MYNSVWNAIRENCLRNKIKFKSEIRERKQAESIDQQQTQPRAHAAPIKSNASNWID